MKEETRELVRKLDKIQQWLNVKYEMFLENTVPA